MNPKNWALLSLSHRKQVLFHCFVRDFNQDNGVCNVLNETEIVAKFREARLRGTAINYLDFGITILAKLQNVLQGCFSPIDPFGIIAIQNVISLEIT